MKERLWLANAVAAIAMLCGLTLLPGTACTKAQGTAIATVGTDVAVCVLNHDTDPPLTIVEECGLSTVEQVLQILDAEHAAQVRHATEAGK